MADPAKPFGLADRPVFVGGLFKSGTSLTRVLLGQHPALFASYETYWFDPQVSEHWDDPASKRMAYLLKFYEIGEAAYGAMCDIKRATPAREFVDIVLEHAVRRAGKPRWVEKTPGNMSHAARIAETWSGSRLVILTREFRDVFASWKVRRGNSLDDFIAGVRTAYEPIMDVLGRDDEHRLYVDYNALVGEPETTMRRVLAFVGEPWDPRCAAVDLDGTSAERERVQEVTGRDNLTSVSLAKPIFQSSVGQWRTMLEPQEARAIERELADLYDRLGSRWADA